MKLIGAGLPRTATTTQMIALEMLGLPCYHMRDMMMNMETSVPQFRKALEGDADWDEIFEGKESEVDWPASYHWRELIEVYPDAKVLLSVRDADSWVRSMQNTINQVFFGDTLIHHLVRTRYQIDQPFAAWIDLLAEMNFGEERGVFGTSDDPRRDGRGHGALEPVGDRHRALGAAARLGPQEGWEPLCEFLEVPVPDTPLPHVNDTENFQKNLIMGPAIAAIDAWWEENRPDEDPADEAAAGPAAASA